MGKRNIELSFTFIFSCFMILWDSKHCMNPNTIGDVTNVVIFVNVCEPSLLFDG